MDTHAERCRGWLGRTRVSGVQCKTLKYRPEFPKCFGYLEEARGFCRWYNEEHGHSGIAYMRPADVHCGRATEVLAPRPEAPQKAYRAHPERFKRIEPEPKPVSERVWINPPVEPKAGDVDEAA